MLKLRMIYAFFQCFYLYSYRVTTCWLTCSPCNW